MMREIKFRAWDGKTMFPVAVLAIAETGWDCEKGRGVSIPYQPSIILMQYTGLKDKNGLTEVYEGDIIDANGIVKGNVYETKCKVYERDVDIIVEGMGTSKWRDTEQAAMERGCKYAE